jgi:dienelactone hydrolase/WD40 repeat protein
MVACTARFCRRIGAICLSPSHDCWQASCVSLRSGSLALILLVCHPAILADKIAHAKTSHSARHPATIEDILSLRQPSSVKISPNGKHVAYVVTEPQLTTNQDHATLYVTSVEKSNFQRAVAQGNHISSVAWSEDSRYIFFVLEAAGRNRIFHVAAAGELVRPLLEIDGRELLTLKGSSENFASYELSPDRKTLICAMVPVAKQKRVFDPHFSGGVVYKDESFWELLPFREQPSSFDRPFELWTYDFERHTAQKIWSIRSSSFLTTHPPEFQISPDGNKLAVLYQIATDTRHTLATIDLRTGKFTPWLQNLGWSLKLKWKASDLLTFVSEGVIERQSTRYDLAPYTFELSTSNLTKLNTEINWTSDSSAVGTRVELAAEKQFGALLHDCSIDSTGSYAACIKESPMIVPDVVALPLKDGTPERRPMVLTQLNPEYEFVQLGSISELTGGKQKSEYGLPAAGLVLPVGYLVGHKYPLLVMLYNLYSGKRFISDADGFTSYPVQAFAGHGYAVLLVNLPEGTFIYKDGNFSDARRAEVDIVVSAVRSEVDLLISHGIADPTRIGIMGWSWGAFWTDYITTHQPEWFQAAASGEGGNHNPGSYWEQGKVFREQERRFYGSGPYGQYAPRWKEIAPVWNVDRLQLPLLMEYSGAFLNGLEMRSAIEDQGGQSELVIYPDDEHVFIRPLNRYNSMTRHFDWFNFWLLGEEDPDPRKAERYERWRKLRKAREGRKERRYESGHGILTGTHPHPNGSAVLDVRQKSGWANESGVCQAFPAH